MGLQGDYELDDRRSLEILKRDRENIAKLRAGWELDTEVGFHKDHTLSYNEEYILVYVYVVYVWPYDFVLN